MTFRQHQVRAARAKWDNLTADEKSEIGRARAAKRWGKTKPKTSRSAKALQA